MKYIPPIVGTLLGLVFIAAGVTFFLKIGPKENFAEGSPVAHFMAAFGPTGYMAFVKVLEILGGLLVAIPKTRSIGLLILGPIIVNILAFQIFVVGGKDLVPTLIIAALPLYLLWVERKRFAGLVC